MVALAGVDQFLPLSTPKVEPVELVLLEREARDHQRLTLRACFLDPIIAAAGIVAAVPHLGDHAFETDPQACLNTSGPSTSKPSLNWMAVLAMSFLRSALRSIKGSFR